MKKKINRYEVTESERHKAANPKYDGDFEIELKVKHGRSLAEDWNAPEKTRVWFDVGCYFGGSGQGKTIDAALADMFGKTDVTEKLASAKRCREAAERLETEALEMEKAQAAEATR